ncbi:hypothetical protein FCV25MIE_29496 [Fagus crenata]
MLAIVREYFTCINRQGSLSTIPSEEESSGRTELKEAILSEFPFIDFSFFLACIFGLIREAQFEDHFTATYSSIPVPIPRWYAVQPQHQAWHAIFFCSDSM